MPSPVFYATIVPLMVYLVVKKGIVEPFLKEEKSKKLEKQKQNNFNKLLEKRFVFVLCLQSNKPTHVGQFYLIFAIICLRFLAFFFTISVKIHFSMCGMKDQKTIFDTKLAFLMRRFIQVKIPINVNFN